MSKIQRPPVSHEASSVIEELLRGVPIVDAHHHLWDIGNTPPVQRGMAFLPWTELAGEPVHEFPPGLTPPEGAEPLPEDQVKAYGKWTANSFGQHNNMIQNYLPADLLQEFAHANIELDSSVFIECVWIAPDDKFGDLGETKWVQENCANPTSNKVAKAIIGHVNLLTLSKDDARELFKKHIAQVPNFRGIRFTITHEEGGPNRFFPLSPKPHIAQDPHWLDNFSLLGEFGLSFELWCFGYQIVEGAELAKQFPGTNFVLDHFGTPVDVYTDDAVYKKWQEDITLLASNPNVYAKLSGLMPPLGYTYHRRKWGAPGPTARMLAESRFGDLVRKTVEVFGVDRCMFGSNFPVDKGSADLAELIGCYLLVLKASGLASPENIAKVFRENAKKFYRI
ncbi:amidohydrolase 2 [Gonapodya prolifera JEL478]|uniref:Amidohydrolase 2 n=1 Tax=Gonapodya prolifera (strain JEL478) TaxID=1344416 RepID=A0A139A4Z1_GONPJ|nr:amidohydrolase 2 [Gonapodya prolifera JEL478]|eukprot:KXS11689.1 amidohydrolase 2 [Gonapodya prolifera JEL478]